MEKRNHTRLFPISTFFQSVYLFQPFLISFSTLSIKIILIIDFNLRFSFLITNCLSLLKKQAETRR